MSKYNDKNSKKKKIARIIYELNNFSLSNGVSFYLFQKANAFRILSF